MAQVLDPSAAALSAPLLSSQALEPALVVGEDDIRLTRNSNCYLILFFGVIAGAAPDIAGLVIAAEAEPANRDAVICLPIRTQAT